MKPVLKRIAPASELPYRDINGAFRLRSLIPADDSVQMEVDENGIAFIRAAGGESMKDLVAGDNIEITRTADGKIVISAVDTATDIAAGQNITIDIDPETGTAIINSITGGATNEHYKGVFDTAEDLIAFDTDPQVGDYGMIKHITYSDGGDTTWNGQYKYCFYINGQWTVVDQMLTFTDDIDLLQQFYSVGGSSPVIYLHKIAQTGSFRDLRDVPIVATPNLTVEGTTLTATCDTEGADIWYTTDGTMPHVNGNKYTGPITVTEATTFRFVGVKNGMINSLEAVASVDYSLEAPVIDLDWTNGEISIENPNAVGTVYYTTDGSEPTNASTEYTEPFASGNVASVTVKAVVYDNGSYSVVSAKTYTRSGGVVSQSANYTSGQMGFRARCTQDGGMVKYTTDGSDPDYTSESLSGWLYYPMFVPTSYKWRTYAPGYLPGSVSTFSGGYAKPTAPTFAFDAETNTVTLGKTGNCQLIELKTTASGPNYGCRIYYTLDGSTPTAVSTLYTGPFQITGNVTVKAVLIAFGQYSSDVNTENIVITNAPTISLNSDTGDITITGPAGSTLYYTRDGSNPTTESTQYTVPFNVTNSLLETIKAIAVVDGQESGIATAEYQGLPWRGGGGNQIDYSIGKIYASPQLAQDGADVSYRGASGWYVYKQPIVVNLFGSTSGINPGTFGFKQRKRGYIPNTYRVELPVETTPDAPQIDYDEVSGNLTINLSGNTAEIPLQTNNNVPTMGARIYYTMDGSTPTAQNGTLYTGAAFAVPAGTTAIKAVTVCYGEFESEVATESLAKAYGVRFAKNSDSPDGERVGNMAAHVSLPIQSRMRRCLLNDDGSVNYYLDPDESTLKADGTAADLTGTDGQFMVEIPSFYGNLLETDDYVEFSISEESIDGYFHFPKMYVSVDEASLDRDTGKLSAVVNNTARYRGGDNDDSLDSVPYLSLLGKPVSNLSWLEFLEAAQLRGDNWVNYINMVHTALYFLYIVEYATKNTQKAYNPSLTVEGYRQGGLGPDVTEFYDWLYIGSLPFIPTGSTASLGNHTGVVDYTFTYDKDGETMSHTAHISSYRGVSVPIGHLGKAASGFFLCATSENDVYAYFCNDPVNMSFAPSAGYDSVRISQSVMVQLVSKLGFTNGNLYPIEGVGEMVEDPTQNLSTYFCDAALVYGSDSASEIYDPEDPLSLVPALGGFASDGSCCGFAFAYCGGGPALANSAIGSRLCFIQPNL